MTQAQVRQQFVGQKMVVAWPENRIDAIGEVGYGVEYECGYHMWNPKEEFEAANKPLDKLDFAGALFMLKRGNRLARSGWNGRGMWIVLVGEDSWVGLDSIGSITRLPFIAMKTVDEKVVPWLASQTDLLAEDWMVV